MRKTAHKNKNQLEKFILFHKITEWLTLGGSSGSIWSNPCSSRVPRRGNPGPQQGSFWSSPRKRLYILQAACASSPSPTEHRSSPGIQRDPPLFQFALSATCLSTGHQRQRFYPLCTLLSRMYRHC